MTDLLRQMAELLADSFLRIMTTESGKWSFRRGGSTVIVAVEIVRDSKEYDKAMEQNGWVVNVS